ncbi:MAG: hypothetical protein Aurels2KO_46100 [Aureliella sp.]
MELDNNSDFDPQSSSPEDASTQPATPHAESTVGGTDSVGHSDSDAASSDSVSVSTESASNDSVSASSDADVASADVASAEVASAVEVEVAASDELTEALSGDVPTELDDPKSIELSAEFVGRWSTLISTTNWEKGRIIIQWREALMGSESPAAAYSDEAWSRRVGGVSAQHVGRLRRVAERFGDEYKTYEGIYWSHFLAALEWDDAEMWLEGAVQSGWSVSQMRRTRWESMGGKPEEKPVEAEVAAASMDEDYEPLSAVDEKDAELGDSTRAVAEGPRADGPDFGDEDEFSPDASKSSEDSDDAAWDTQPGDEEKPFASLPSLPVDLAEAVEQFKLGIIRHRADQWSEVSQADVLKALEALKSFANL